MQAKSTERTMRDLFHALVLANQVDAAAGVYLAAGALGLDRKSWRLGRPVILATVALRPVERSTRQERQAKYTPMARA
jgi:hypothetical protein